MTEDKVMLDYLLLLRFGGRDHALTSPPILSFAAIAKLINKPPETVRRLIAVALQALKEGREVV